MIHDSPRVAATRSADCDTKAIEVASPTIVEVQEGQNVLMK